MVRQMSEAEVTAAMEMYERMQGTVKVQGSYPERLFLRQDEPWAFRRAACMEMQFLYATVDGIEVYDALEECEDGYDLPKYGEENYDTSRRTFFHEDSKWSDTCQ